jgi:polyribonucleotide nucleotidyltransferase
MLDNVTRSVLDVRYGPGGERGLTLETGEIGRLAGGAVFARSLDTTVYATACCDTDSPPQYGSFAPLHVVYTEHLSAAGRTSGGFLKRDGRPREADVLTSRLVDRPIRPLFPMGFIRDTQVPAAPR